MAAYQVENYFTGDDAVWNMEGTWIIGNRDDQHITNIDIVSNNGGKTLTGTIRYDRDGAFNFRARLDKDNMYRTEVKSVLFEDSWHSDGTWVFGSREKCIKLNVSSDSSKMLLSGVAEYDGIGEAEFEGNYISFYKIENHWGKESASWHFGGMWVLTSRIDNTVVEMDIFSEDLGETFKGSIQYKGEEAISFKAERTVGNNYKVYNKWGNDDYPWYRCGDMIIGDRENQRVIKLKFNSDDNGKNIYGHMVYEGEKSIGFKGKMIK